MAPNTAPDESTPAAPGPRLFVTLLGHLQMTVDGAHYVLTTKRKTLPLLAYLLLHRNENLARDFVAYLLWPDETEEDALTKLRSNLHELGKALPPEGDAPWLLVSGSHVRWNPAVALELDIERFERAANDPERLDEAVRLYTSDLLEGIDDEWILTERERLQALLFTALERGIGRAARAGDLGRAVAYGQQLLARDPFREDVVRRVMSLRDAGGDAAAHSRNSESSKPSFAANSASIRCRRRWPYAIRSRAGKPRFSIPSERTIDRRRSSAAEPTPRRWWDAMPSSNACAQRGCARARGEAGCSFSAARRASASRVWWRNSQAMSRARAAE